MLLARSRGGGDLPPEQRFCRPSLEQALNRVALGPACRSDGRRQFVDDLTRLPCGPETIGSALQGRCIHPAMIARRAVPPSWKCNMPGSRAAREHLVDRLGRRGPAGYYLLFADIPTIVKKPKFD